MSTPDPNPPPSDYSGVRRFFAGLLMAAGALLILLSGACTISIAIEDPQWAWVAFFASLFGLVPGIAMLLIGRKLWRE
jgi:hypothetical protein